MKTLLKRFSFEFHCDWDSLMFWRDMNWRDFTIIMLDIETAWKHKTIDINFGLLGFNFRFIVWHEEFMKVERTTTYYFTGEGTNEC